MIMCSHCLPCTLSSVLIIVLERWCVLIHVFICLEHFDQIDVFLLFVLNTLMCSCLEYFLLALLFVLCDHIVKLLVLHTL